MIADLKPYTEYKESGISWLGKIPSNWDVRRMKLLLSEVDSRSSSGREQLLRISQYTGVTQRKASDGSDEPDTRASSLVGYKRVAVNDFVINIMLAWNGSMGVSRYDGIASPAYCVYRFKSGALPWYYHELLRLPVYKGRIKTASTGVVESRLRLYSDDLGRIEAIQPPPDEQAAIVRFLDHANRRLERTIRAKRKVIALLNEQKQAIIHRAVTRGLDPNVPLKPSGIPWLGDVPEHWEVVRLKTLISRVISGSRGWSNFEADYGPLFIRIGNLTRASLGLDFSDVVRLSLPREALSEGARTKVQADDILLSITAYIGSVAVVPEGIEDAYVSQHVACCRPRSGAANVRWVGYVLLSRVGQVHGQLCMYGGTKQGLSLDDVKNYVVLLPSRNEQDSLVKWIESESENAGCAISRLEREIALLREYRTRLIADVVTRQAGRARGCGAAAGRSRGVGTARRG